MNLLELERCREQNHTTRRECRASCVSAKGILNTFESERSKVWIPGPTSGSRGELPNIPTLRANAAVLNHKLASLYDSLAGLRVPKCGSYPKSVISAR